MVTRLHFFGVLLGELTSGARTSRVERRVPVDARGPKTAESPSRVSTVDPEAARLPLEGLPARFGAFASSDSRHEV
jgi:hypothetical protein